MDSGVVQFGQNIGPVVSKTFGVAASVVFKDTGGKFVQMNTSGYVLIAVAGVTDIIGWAQTGEFTASATAGQTKVAVNLALDAVYEMPLDEAQTEAQLIALVGELHDLIVTSDIQYVNIDGTSNNVVKIVGYRYWGSALGQQSVLVQLVPKNITLAA